MLCPSCNKGTLRVVVVIRCACGHHPFVCDDCCEHFAVACGPPFGEAKLPPEFPLEPHRLLNEMRQHDPNVSRNEDFRPFLTQFPTVENFKLIVADGDWDDGNDSFSQQHAEADGDDPDDGSKLN